jgi:hypothetical protein
VKPIKTAAVEMHAKIEKIKSEIAKRGEKKSTTKKGNGD